MKAVLEPNEILIRQVPNEKCPDGNYYITETFPPEAGGAWSNVYYTLEEVVQRIYDIFEPKSAPRK